MIISMNLQNGTVGDFGTFAQSTTSEAMGKASWPLVVLIGFSLVQVIRNGAHKQYLWLGVGAFLAGIAMFFYGLISVQRGYGRPKRAWMGFAAVGGFVPYLYSLYVIGYWGCLSFLDMTAST